MDSVLFKLMAGGRKGVVETCIDQLKLNAMLSLEGNTRKRSSANYYLVDIVWNKISTTATGKQIKYHD